MLERVSSFAFRSSSKLLRRESRFVVLYLFLIASCFDANTAKDGMKDAIVAKLTAQATEYYETANALLNGPLKNIIPSFFCIFIVDSFVSTIDRNFAGNVELWAFIHRASFQHRLGNVAAEVKKYKQKGEKKRGTYCIYCSFGEQVARLAAADNLMNEAKKRISRSTPPDLKVRR